MFLVFALSLKESFLFFSFFFFWCFIFFSFTKVLLTNKILRHLKVVISYMYILWRDSYHLVKEHNYDLTYFYLCIYLFSVRTLTFYFFSKSQFYNTVLLVIITFCIRCSDFIHCIGESLYPFTNLFLFPPTPISWQPLSFTVSVSLTFVFRFQI